MPNKDLHASAKELIDYTIKADTTEQIDRNRALSAQVFASMVDAFSTHQRATPINASLEVTKRDGTTEALASNGVPQVLSVCQDTNHKIETSTIDFSDGSSQKLTFDCDKKYFEHTKVETSLKNGTTVTSTSENGFQRLDLKLPGYPDLNLTFIQKPQDRGSDKWLLRQGSYQDTDDGALHSFSRLE